MINSRRGITVTYLRSNSAYDIYRVTGVDTVEENGEPIYHEELRGGGINEEYVLNLYVEEY
jgi:hypothetical protein